MTSPEATLRADAAASDEDADRIETVVIGVVEDEGWRIRVAERGSLLPVGGGQALTEPRAPVAFEHNTLHVVARGRGQRRATLQQIGAEALHGEAGRAQRGDRALAALLEGELAALVPAALHLGLAQATLERGMSGQEETVQELGLLDDDLPAGTDHARELGQRAAGLLDVMENVAA